MNSLLITNDNTQAIPPTRSKHIPLQYTFPTVVRVIRDELRNQPDLCKMTSQKQRLFSVDLALIGLSVRTGYLVDVVALQHPLERFSAFLKRLRQKYSFFKNIVHLYEPASDQSFFVNVPLFVQRMAVDGCLREGISLSNTDDLHLNTSFILLGLDGHLSLLSRPPDDVTAVLRDLNTNLTTQTPLSLSITLPSLRPQTAIPLTAFLLEYPVAYVPVSPDQSPFLSHVRLDVYECVLTSQPQRDNGDIHDVIPNRHTLLKFSCPSGLANKLTQRIAPAQILAELKARLEARSQRALTGVVFSIQQTSETRDSVAL